MSALLGGVVSLMPRPLYTRGKIPRYPLDRRLGGSRYVVILVTVAVLTAIAPWFLKLKPVLSCIDRNCFCVKIEMCLKDKLKHLLCISLHEITPV
jgi:hypothetical protein